MPRIDAIDVAHHQGPIDWFQAYASGVRVCSIRATTGLDITTEYQKAVTGHAGPIGGMYVDDQFTNNRVNSAAAGVEHRLFYHLLNGPHSLEVQADHFLSTIGHLAEGEGVLLDYEVAPWTVQQATAWLEYVEERTGRPPGIYGGVRAGWRDLKMFNGPFGPRPRWLACWISEAKARKAAAPYWGDAWQWTSKGTLPGINGRVDLSQVDNAAGFDACCGYKGSDSMVSTVMMRRTYKDRRIVIASNRITKRTVKVPRQLILHTGEFGEGLSISSFIDNHLTVPGDRVGSTPTSRYGSCYDTLVSANINDPEAVEILDPEWAPFAAGDPWNNQALHLCFFGTAYQTPEQWADAGSMRQLHAAARYAARLYRSNGVLPRRLTHQQAVANEAGVFGHNDAWGHADPGGNFPWTTFFNLMNHYIQGDDMSARIVTVYDDTTWQQVSIEAWAMVGCSMQWIESTKQYNKLISLGAASTDPNTGKPYGIWRTDLINFRRVGKVWSDTPFADSEWLDVDRPGPHPIV